MHHEAGLRRLLKSKRISARKIKSLLDALKKDFRTADLTPAEIAMLTYAVKLTHTPQKITKRDISALRAEGYDDRAIHDICCITAYYAFVNRIADGLGVEMESAKR